MDFRRHLGLFLGTLLLLAESSCGTRYIKNQNHRYRGSEQNEAEERLGPPRLSPMFAEEPEGPMSKIEVVVAGAKETLRRHQESNTLSKVDLTNYGQSFQYVEYDTSLPPITDFHFCIWMKSKNLSSEHTLFSYAVRDNPNMIAMWISPVQNQTGFHLVINGIKVYNLNYVIPLRKWTHFCQTWKSASGQWGIFVNGNSVGDGYGPQKLIGLTIPGGGKPITGQEQDAFLRGQGIEGEITLFEMHNTNLPVGSKGTDLIRPLLNDCSTLNSQNAGNLISWETTPLKLYGGAEITRVRPICGGFPK